MKAKTKLSILLSLLAIFLFFSIFNSRFSKNIIANDNYLEFNEKDQVQIKQSGFWDLTESQIFIDDSATGVGAHNWTWAETQPWCSGSGSWADPYVIENVTIDGKYSGRCIEIMNSNTYFIIRNCTIYNSSTSASGAAIKLSSVDNGKLINNNCSNNGNYGIDLWESDNNTLSENVVNNNSVGINLGYSNRNAILGNIASINTVGIQLHYSNINAIWGNNASKNISEGIEMQNCDNNALSENTASYGSYTYSIGIILWDCDNNTLSGNTANNNFRGISIIWNSYINKLWGNIANNNDQYGIFVFGSNNNTITGNSARNNGRILGENYVGVGIGSSYNTTISRNTISNNSKGLVLDSDCDNNKIFLNYFIKNTVNAEDNGINTKWDNGSIGNYWYDYVGVDANQDGIGDTPYIIPGTAGSQDNFPTWTDNIAPVITIIFPLLDSVFGLDAPNYNISIDELNLDTMWYTLDGGETNYTISSLTGMFNQTAWEALSEGSVTIRFYAIDAAGNIGFINVEVVKEIPEDPDDVPLISFGNYYMLFTTIAILSFIILENYKKKKR